MSQDLYPVKPHIAERAYIRSMEEYQRLYRLSLDNPEWFWGEQAKAHHAGSTPGSRCFDADYDEVDFAWFSGGRLNASFNCVDRHLPDARRPHGASSGRRTSPASTGTSPTAS